MYIESEVLEGFTLKYPLERIAPLEDFLFFDIETTGFQAKGTYLYLIGVAYYEDGEWKTKQLLADNFEEEAKIITAFFRFAEGFTRLVHYNGNNFDLPYIMAKCAEHGLDYSFEQFEGMDVYRRVTPYRESLGLPNCKQKTIEAFLGIKRLDVYDGGDLISVYHDYVASPENETRAILLLHNSCDLMGMLEILPILAYQDLFTAKPRAKKVEANYYTDIGGNAKNMLYIKLRLAVALPQPISFSRNGCYFKGEGEEGFLAVPLYTEEMKYFYANYKEYYYLPAEDVALHKLVAGYVDKEHRRPATAATCYTRQEGTYLPQWSELVKPFFKRSYDDKELFFEITDELKRNRRFFGDYALHILNMMMG